MVPRLDHAKFHQLDSCSEKPAKGLKGGAHSIPMAPRNCRHSERVSMSLSSCCEVSLTSSLSAPATWSASTSWGTVSVNSGRDHATDVPEQCKSASKHAKQAYKSAAVLVVCASKFWMDAQKNALSSSPDMIGVVPRCRRGAQISKRVRQQRSGCFLQCRGLEEKCKVSFNFWDLYNQMIDGLSRLHYSNSTTLFTLH